MSIWRECKDYLLPKYLYSETGQMVLPVLFGVLLEVIALSVIPPDALGFLLMSMLQVSMTFMADLFFRLHSQQQGGEAFYPKLGIARSLVVGSLVALLGGALGYCVILLGATSSPAITVSALFMLGVNYGFRRYILKNRSLWKSNGLLSGSSSDSDDSLFEEPSGLTRELSPLLSKTETAVDQEAGWHDANEVVGGGPSFGMSGDVVKE